MATRKLPKATAKAKNAQTEITPEFVRSLPPWEPALNRDDVDKLERRHVGSGDLAINRRIALMAATRTQEQWMKAWRDDIATDKKCKTMFMLLEQVGAFRDVGRGMVELAEATHARMLGAGILVGDEEYAPPVNNKAKQRSRK
jgi:hypothetical protein